MRPIIEQEGYIAKFSYKYDRPAFPFNMTRIENRWDVKHIPHWQEDFEFIFQSEGSTVFKVGAKTVKLKRGQAIFVNLGEFHSTYSTSDYSGVYYSVIFSPDILVYSPFPDSFQKDFLTPLIQKQCHIPCLFKGDSPWEKEVLKQIGNIIELHTTKPPAFELGIRAYLYNVFFILSSNNQVKKITKKDSFLDTEKVRRINNSLDFIHEHYQNKITEQDLAVRANTNYAYFSRLFKYLMGRSPIEYINNYRVGKAVSLLLADRNRKIVDIALEVGFENLSHFNRIFKKLKKCTPTDFRAYYEEPSSKEPPQGWNGKSIGSDISLGWISSKDNKYTISSWGGDIWNQDDRFYFAYMEVDGDHSITARLNSIKSVEKLAKSGVMIRQSLDADSTFAHVVVNSSNTVLYQQRRETGKWCTSTEMANITTPVYLKLTRTGKKFSAHYSCDGNTWVQVGSTLHLEMGSRVFTGLAITSYYLETPSIAVFDCVHIKTGQ